ncbi:MAG TPA: ABC transporter substrate-binding protein [Stellaceae bacterium]|nr:ABC transporter substrate-binding protein [Stellaceae bacterium]
MIRRDLIAASFGAAFFALWCGDASASDKLVVGKAFPTSFGFIPINVGVESGIMAKYGLDVAIVGFEGAPKLQQGITAGDVDIGLGSGTDMAFVKKGAPCKAVAAMAGPPLAYSIFAGAESGIDTVQDLKGRKIAVASPNSLVYWLTRHLSDRLGWGLDGIQTVYVSGGNAANIAMLRTKQVDGLTGGLDGQRLLEKQHLGKVLANYGQYVTLYLTHAIYASDTLIATRPEVLRRFLQAWFATINYMHANKAETVRIDMKADGIADAEIASLTYDDVMPMFSRDGRFDPAALEVVRKATVELGLLDTEPDMAPLYTEAFLPETRR